METRKIIGFGKNSLIISLPKDWIARNNLGKGKEVFMEYSSNEIRIRSNKNENVKTEKKGFIDVNKLSLPFIKRDICSNYINNSNLIELKGEGVRNYGTEIKNYLREFMVFEIIEEKDDIIIAKDYLNLDNMEKEKIIERMVSILKSMFSDLGKTIDPKTYESIENRDSQINKYHFLMERYARYHLSSQYSTEDRVKILDFVQISILLESLGDYIKLLCSRILSNKLKQDKVLLKLLAKCEEYFSENMKSLLTEDRYLFINATSNFRDNLYNDIQNLNVSESDKNNFDTIVRNIHKSGRSVLGFSKGN